MYLKWVPSHSMQKTNYMPEMDTSGQPMRVTLGNGAERTFWCHKVVSPDPVPRMELPIQELGVKQAELTHD